MLYFGVMKLPEFSEFGSSYDQQAFLLMDLQDKKVQQLRDTTQIVDKAETVVSGYLRAQRNCAATIRPSVFVRSTFYPNGDLNSKVWGICFMVYPFDSLESDVIVKPSYAQVQIAESVGEFVIPKNQSSIAKFSQEEAETIYAVGQEIARARQQLPNMSEDLTMIDFPSAELGQA